MSHELDFSSGQAAFAYVGSQGWHGFGQALTPEASIEEWAQQAHMNWQVESAPAMYMVGEEQLFVPARKVYYRSDSKKSLAVVSNDHHEVQPLEVLEWFRDLTGGAGFSMETAGCLYEGRKFFALAKSGNEVKIMNQDIVKPYLLLATSCDGSMATCAHFTSVRVVCSNTLRMAIGSGQKVVVRVPHNGKFDGEKAKAELGLKGEEAWELFIANATKLAKTKISYDDALWDIAAELKDDWRTPEGEEMTPIQMLDESRPLNAIMQLFNGKMLGADYKSSKGTMWGLMNAVTEYTDHHTAIRSPDKMFERALLTDKASFKVSVANKLLKLAA
jgi:phage/plasmid-like protein (TIGR03299 family)